MPTYIRGCDAKSWRSVDQSRTALNKERSRLRCSLEPALRSQITTLAEPYMLTIQGGQRSIEMQGEDDGQQRTHRRKPLRESRRARFLWQTQSGNGRASQLPDAGLALRLTDRQNGDGSVAFEGLRSSTELGE